MITIRFVMSGLAFPIGEGEEHPESLAVPIWRRKNAVVTLYVDEGFSSAQ